MVTVKEAVQAAENWLRALIPKADLKHLRLEEVELSDDERYWHITLGWLEPAFRESTPMSAMFSNEMQMRVLPRVYKTLEVDAETGTVKSMKIREVA